MSKTTEVAQPKRGRGRPRKYPIVAEAVKAIETIVNAEQNPPRVISGLLATVKQAAHALQVSERTVVNLMNAGVLRSVKIAGTRRIHWDALRALALTGAELPKAS